MDVICQRHFKTNDASAQEAHACIYPTKISMDCLEDDEDITWSNWEKKVYGYIWLYTVSSQMSPSETKTTKGIIVGDKITNSKKVHFVADHHQLVFEGYLKAWGKIAVAEEDDDNKSDKIVFNKTVGLRDNWAKQRPQQNNNQNQHKPNPQQSQRKAINVIQQLGKKYTNYPEEKQQKVKAEIQELAKNISYDDLEPLFGTAAKKAGTRIATMISLNVMLKNGLERNEAIDDFIAKALEDKNDLLVTEAKAI